MAVKYIVPNLLYTMNYLLHAIRGVEYLLYTLAYNSAIVQKKIGGTPFCGAMIKPRKMQCQTKTIDN